MTTGTQPFPTHAHTYQSYRRAPLKWQYQDKNGRRRGTSTLHVTASLVYMQGNSRPYFSVTGEIINRMVSRDACLACGCLHEEISTVFPKLRPVISLHLSDDLGNPRHAKANGWYWLAGYWGDTGDRFTGNNSSSQPYTGELCLQIFAGLVRIPLDTARELADALKVRPCAGKTNERRRAHDEWIEAQRDRWQQEAEAAIALLDALRTPPEEPVSIPRKSLK